MASVRELESLLQAYLDKEVSDSERLLVEHEVGSNSQAARQLDSQRAVNALLYRALGEPRLRHSLRDGVMAHLPEMDRPDAVVLEVNQRAKQRGRNAPALFAWVPLATLAAAMVIAWALWETFPVSGSGAADTIGVVAYRSGGVWRSSDSDTERERVRIESFVQRADRFEVEEGGSAMLSLAGNTHLKIDGNTRLKVERYRQIQLERGRVWFDVGKDKNLFRIVTPHGNVTVFGTVFEVRVDSERSVVTVSEGQVMVENDLTLAELGVDQQAVLQHGLDPVPVSGVDSSVALAWAGAIAATPKAEQLYAQSVRLPASSQIKLAESTFFIELSPGDISPDDTISLHVEWRPNNFRSGHCRYYVYVKDMKGGEMRPLLKDELPAAVLNDPERSSYELSVPGELVQDASVLFIQMVPDRSTGQLETVFNRVSATGL